MDGSLLTDDYPYIDESQLVVVSHDKLLDSDGYPAPFVIDKGGLATGMSDHLPIRGRLVLEKHQ